MISVRNSRELTYTHSSESSSNQATSQERTHALVQGRTRIVRGDQVYCAGLENGLEDPKHKPASKEGGIVFSKSQPNRQYACLK